MTTKFRWIFAGALGIGVIICVFVVLGASDLTSSESALLAIILTMLSILATWLVSGIYSQEEHQRGLQLHAKKAAEKVDNLSEQLDQLSFYLEEELQNDDYETPAEELNSKEERIHSAIQMIRMLKSVNDGALSDWRGVLGEEEIEEAQEERREREESLRTLVEKVDALTEKTEHGVVDSTYLETFLMNLAAEIRGVAPRRVRGRMQRATVSVLCPKCSEPLSEYRQRTGVRSFKAVSCDKCHSSYISRFDASSQSFYLEQRIDRQERLDCPKCAQSVQFMLNTFPNTSITLRHECGAQFRVVREPSKLAVRIVNPKTVRRPTDILPLPAEELTEEIIEKVRAALPPQPWPTGVNREVAQRLGLSRGLVHRAIRKLMERGNVRVQLGGVLYVPESDATTVMAGDDRPPAQEGGAQV